MRLDGTTIVITGGAQGLGLAVGAAAVTMGAEVALLDVDGQRLSAAQDELGRDHCVVIKCDVRDPKDVALATSDLVAWRPRIDVLINNAGVWTDNDLETASPARRNDALATNAAGAIHVTEALLPVFRRQGSGHILNVISAAGDMLSPGGDNRAWRAYGASKWAMNGYTTTLRQELTGSPIKVTGFFPGGIDTNLYENAGWPSEQAHGQPWMMRTEDVADIILFALTRPADMLIESLTVVKRPQ